MKTEFIGLNTKSEIVERLKAGDETAIKTVLNEFDRLESIIKDYEIILVAANEKLESRIFKKPNA